MKLRLAVIEELDVIWKILQDAIAQRKKDGSDQWQNGYPNKQTVIDDIQNGYGHVLIEDDIIVAYSAIIFGIEPNYIDIKGKWLSDDKYVAVHRVATSENYKGKGIATQLFNLIEELSINDNTYSIKVDTNFDNAVMLRILEKLSYTYCGEIFVSGATRMAFEKLLSKG
jgi:GNAT superfamily N-acetyltransferase